MNDIYIKGEPIVCFEQLKVGFLNADSSVRSSLLEYARNGILTEWLNDGDDSEKQMADRVKALNYELDDSSLWNCLTEILVGEKCNVKVPSFTNCFELKNVSSDECAIEFDSSGCFILYVPRYKINLCLTFNVVNPQHESVQLCLQSPYSQKTELGMLSLKDCGNVKFNIDVAIDVRGKCGLFESGGEWNLLANGDKMSQSIFVVICSKKVVQLLKSAILDDEVAQYELGNCYFMGQGISQSYELAVKWYRKSAELGFAKAQYKYGICFEKGEGIKSSNDEAFKWFCKAAEQGNDYAQNHLGSLYYEGQNVLRSYEKAVEWFRKSADQGNSVAQYNLGLCYEYAQGVFQSDVEAINWYRKSAAQGFKKAENKLIELASDEFISEHNDEATIKKLCECAEEGDVKAQIALGDCYRRGSGVKKSRSEAMKWYRKAAEQSNPDAMFKLGNCYYEQSKTDAVEWYLKAAKLGSEEAQYELGVCFDNAKGVRQSTKEAVKWYRISAENGYAKAQNHLGICYITGHGVKYNIEEAEKWYGKSAAQGYEPAKENLRRMHNGWD